MLRKGTMYRYCRVRATDGRATGLELVVSFDAQGRVRAELRVARSIPGEQAEKATTSAIRAACDVLRSTMREDHPDYAPAADRELLALAECFAGGE